MAGNRNYVWYLGVNTLLRIKYCIKIGYSIDEISEHFNITREAARKLYVKYSNIIKNSDPCLGRKDEPYYEGENLTEPTYKLEDLTGEEAEIAELNINPGKLWTWEE